MWPTLDLEFYEKFNSKLLERAVAHEKLSGFQKGMDRFALRNDYILVCERYKSLIQRNIKENVDFRFLSKFLDEFFPEKEGDDAALKQIVNLLAIEEFEKEKRKRNRVASNVKNLEWSKKSILAHKISDSAIENKYLQSRADEIDEFKSYCLSLNLDELELMLSESNKYSENEVKLIRFSIRKKVN